MLMGKIIPQQTSLCVSAINDEGETCSDVVFHKGVERGGSEVNSDDDGISRGRIAAIHW